MVMIVDLTLGAEYDGIIMVYSFTNLPKMPWFGSLSNIIEFKSEGGLQ